jgi:hypothetical protein
MQRRNVWSGTDVAIGKSINLRVAGHGCISALDYIMNDHVRVDREGNER